MILSETYDKCGLKQPKQYLKDLINDALFNGNNHAIENVLNGRWLGTTTNCMINAICHLYNGKSSVIWNRSYVALGFNKEHFWWLTKDLDDLKVRRAEDKGLFMAKGIENCPIVYFGNKEYYKQHSRLFSHNFDFEYDDSTDFPWEIKRQ